jgi:hypothetical protein
MNAILWTRVELLIIGRPWFALNLRTAQRTSYALRQIRIVSAEDIVHESDRVLEKVVLLVPDRMVAAWKVMTDERTNLMQAAMNQIWPRITRELEKSPDYIPF